MDYDVLDEYIQHEGCIYIPYPIIGWGWIRIFYNPSDKSFLYDQYSTGYIDDGELRYHGTKTASVDQIVAALNKDWPPNEKGKKVLNDILERDFPEIPLLTIVEETPKEKEPEPEPENIHQEIWSL